MHAVRVMSFRVMRTHGGSCGSGGKLLRGCRRAPAARQRWRQRRDAVAGRASASASASGVAQPASTAFVSNFREAAPYIARHSGKTFVVTVSGDDTHETQERRFASILSDVALLSSLGVRVVMVLGCAKKIDEIIRERGGAPVFTPCELATAQTSSLAGTTGRREEMAGWGASCMLRRVTDKLALQAAKEAAGETSVRVAALLNRHPLLSLVRRHAGSGSATEGSAASARVVSGNFVEAMRVGVVGGVDFQHTGRVRGMDRVGISRQLDMGNIVTLSNLGYSSAGEVLNCQVRPRVCACMRIACRRSCFPLLMSSSHHPGFLTLQLCLFAFAPPLFDAGRCPT